MFHAEEHTLGNNGHLHSQADCELISLSVASFFLFPARLWIYCSVSAQCNTQHPKAFPLAGEWDWQCTALLWTEQGGKERAHGNAKQGRLRETTPLHGSCFWSNCVITGELSTEPAFAQDGLKINARYGYWENQTPVKGTWLQLCQGSYSGWCYVLFSSLSHCRRNWFDFNYYNEFFIKIKQETVLERPGSFPAWKRCTLHLCCCEEEWYPVETKGGITWECQIAFEKSQCSSWYWETWSHCYLHCSGKLWGFFFSFF